MKFDLNKCERNADGHWLCRTVDGMKVRIVCQDLARENGHVLLGVVSQYDGHDDEIRCYTKDGFCSLNGNPSRDDLVNLPRKVKRWVNVPPLGCPAWFYTSENEANGYRSEEQQTIPIEWEEPS